MEIAVKQGQEPAAETADNATHLYISYATEDIALATWLARKLAAAGYAVWFDKLKLLGGEPWPQSIDDAIKHRTFRMLALMSAHSFSKPNPTKERTAALDVARKKQIPDFLITLKVDDAELDWQTTDISYISFNDGWAEGLRRLLKKLNSISAPKILKASIATAAATFPRGNDLLLPKPEQLYANVVRVKKFPAILRVFRVGGDLNSDERNRLGALWPYYRINDDTLVALFPPPPEFESKIQSTMEQCLWTDSEFFHGVRARDIAANLIVRVLGRRLVKAGCGEHPTQVGYYYLPSNFTKDGKLWFPGYRGKQTWLLIRGCVTFRRAGGLRELNFHHFAFRLRLARGLDKFFYVQITPSLFFVDQSGRAILDKTVGSRRKRLTRMWWNHKWFTRLLAATHLLTNLPSEGETDMELEDGLVSAAVPLSLDEEALELLDTEDGSEAESEVELEDEDATEIDE